MFCHLFYGSQCIWLISITVVLSAVLLVRSIDTVQTCYLSQLVYVMFDASNCHVLVCNCRLVFFFFSSLSLLHSALVANKDIICGLHNTNNSNCSFHVILR